MNTRSLHRVLSIIGLLLVSFIISFLVVGETVHTLSVNQEFGSIDPAKTNDWTETIALVNLYDALVEPTSEGEMVPHLAKDWSRSEDNMTYTFSLREDVKFHDGSNLTAEDVAFSLERMLKINQGYSWLWEGIIDPENCCEVVDDYTVKIKLQEKFAPFVATLAYFGVVNKDLLMENKKEGKFGEYGDYGQDYLNNNDAGSGAYEFSEWRRGSTLIFTRYEDYFKGWPRENPIDEVRAKLIGSESTLKAQMRAGDLDQVDHWRSTDFYQFVRDLANAKIVETNSGAMYKLQINVQAPPTDDIHVRKAINYAFDYETYLEQIEPNAVQARGPVSQSVPMFAYDAYQYEHNLDKARKEIAKSGYEPGNITINYVYMTGFAISEQVGLLLQQELDKIGVDLKMQPETWGRMSDLATDPKSSPNLMAVYGPSNYLHPDAYLWPCYYSESAGTWASSNWVQSEVIDSLLEKGRKTFDEKRAEVIYQQVQVLLSWMATDVFLNPMLKRYPVQNYVNGLEPMPIMGYGYNFWDYHYSK